MSKYFGYEFTKEKNSSLIDGETRVVFESKGAADPSTNFSVTAHRVGIRINGDSPLICTESDLQEFAKLISDAWVEHRKLAPKLHRSLSGH